MVWYSTILVEFKVDDERMEEWRVLLKESDLFSIRGESHHV